MTFHSSKGFTLFETMLALTVVVIILVPLSRLEVKTYSLARFFQNTATLQDEARKTLQVLMAELRSAGPSEAGSYPIEEATDTTLVFFRDINNDGLTERIKYYVDDNQLKKDVVVPSGNPATYPLGNPVTTIVAHDVANGTQPVFSYFDNNYDGSTQPLAEPVDVTVIRLVKAEIIIGKGNGEQGQVILTTQVQLRNLKDNL